MNVTLENLLKENKPLKFESVPFYCKEDDSVHLYFDNIASFAERVDNYLDVYRNFDDKSIIVGFKIKNIKSIIDNLNNFKIIDDYGKIKLGSIVTELLLSQFLTMHSMIYCDIFDLIITKDLCSKEFSIIN